MIELSKGISTVQFHDYAEVWLQWLGTAGFWVGTNSTSFVIDPYVTRNSRATPHQPLKPADLRTVQAIFLSHGHFDHASDLPAILAESHATVYGSATALATVLNAGVSPGRLQPVRDGDWLDFEEFRAQAFASRHIRFDIPLVLRGLQRAREDILTSLNLAIRYPAGQVISWRFFINGYSIHHFGSAGSTDVELKQLAHEPVDILLLPLAGHSHIERTITRYIELLRPRAVILHHYDDFYPPISAPFDTAPAVERLRQRFPQTPILTPQINQKVLLPASGFPSEAIIHQR